MLLFHRTVTTTESITTPANQSNIVNSNLNNATPHLLSPSDEGDNNPPQYTNNNHSLIAKGKVKDNK
jgi:hypothetical protein